MSISDPSLFPGNLPGALFTDYVTVPVYGTIQLYGTIHRNSYYSYVWLYTFAVIVNVYWICSSIWNTYNTVHVYGTIHGEIV